MLLFLPISYMFYFPITISFGWFLFIEFPFLVYIWCCCVLSSSNIIYGIGDSILMLSIFSEYVNSFLFFCFYILFLYSCFISWHWYHMLYIIVCDVEDTIFMHSLIYCLQLLLIFLPFFFSYMLYYFVSKDFVSLLYLCCCCVYYFPWVQCYFDGWMFLWLIILRLSPMLLISLFLLFLLMFLPSIFLPCIKKCLYCFDVTYLYLYIFI